jgi:transcriptional regulator with XRE-family HTH domain
METHVEALTPTGQGLRAAAVASARLGARLGVCAYSGMDSIGKRVAELRKQLGLTQAGLLKEVNKLLPEDIVLSTMQRLEKDRTKDPHSSFIDALARVLGVSSDYLMNGPEGTRTMREAVHRTVTDLGTQWNSAWGPKPDEMEMERWSDRFAAYGGGTPEDAVERLREMRREVAGKAAKVPAQRVAVERKAGTMKVAESKGRKR